MAMMGTFFECFHVLKNCSQGYTVQNCLRRIHVVQQFWQGIAAFKVLLTFQIWLVGGLVVMIHIVHIMLALLGATSADL